MSRGDVASTLRGDSERLQMFLFDGAFSPLTFGKEFARLLGKGPVRMRGRDERTCRAAMFVLGSINDVTMSAERKLSPFGKLIGRLQVGSITVDEASTDVQLFLQAIVRDVDPTASTQRMKLVREVFNTVEKINAEIKQGSSALAGKNLRLSEYVNLVGMKCPVKFMVDDALRVTSVVENGVFNSDAFGAQAAFVDADASWTAFTETCMVAHRCTTADGRRVSTPPPICRLCYLAVDTRHLKSEIADATGLTQNSQASFADVTMSPTLDLALNARMIASTKVKSTVADIIRDAADPLVEDSNETLGDTLRELAPSKSSLRQKALEMATSQELVYSVLRSRPLAYDLRSICTTDHWCAFPWVKFCLTVFPLTAFKCNFRVSSPLPAAAALPGPIVGDETTEATAKAEAEAEAIAEAEALGKDDDDDDYVPPPPPRPSLSIPRADDAELGPVDEPIMW